MIPYSLVDSCTGAKFSNETATSLFVAAEWLLHSEDVDSRFIRTSVAICQSVGFTSQQAIILSVSQSEISGQEGADKGQGRNCVYCERET
jgi:hypothetical protein